jgi:hypothetical protein
MIFARLFLCLFLAVLIPGVALSQQQFANSSANHAKTSTQTQIALVQISDLTNARVVEMTKLGLDDEIIMAKIKNGKCRFDLGDADSGQKGSNVAHDGRSQGWWATWPYRDGWD